MRRIDGRGIGRFFAEEIARPFGLDLWIGLPEQKVTAATAPHTDHLSEPWPLSTLPAPTRLRYGLGYQLGYPMAPMLSPHSFGHAGIGGQLSFADPATGVAVGYTCTNLAWQRPTRAGGPGPPRSPTR